MGRDSKRKRLRRIKQRLEFKQRELEEQHRLLKGTPISLNNEGKNRE